MRTLVVALISIAMSVAAQFALKAGVASPGVRAALDAQPSKMYWLSLALNPGVILGFTLYGLGAVVWLSVLAKWDVSKAYPLVGLGFVLSLVIGWMMGESVSIARVAGVAFIVLGVVLVSSS